MTGESICGGTLYLPSKEEALYRSFDHCTGTSFDGTVSQLIDLEPRSNSRSSNCGTLLKDDSSLLTPSKLRINGDADTVCDMNSRRDGSDSVKALLLTAKRKDNVRGNVRGNARVIFIVISVKVPVIVCLYDNT